jgi:YHS domain-containing protein
MKTPNIARLLLVFTIALVATSFSVENLSAQSGSRSYGGNSRSSNGNAYRSNNYSSNRNQSNQYRQNQQQYRQSQQGQQTQGQQTQRPQQTTAQQRLQQLQQIAANNRTKLALEGYCPVAVVSNREWVAGNAAYSAMYDGMTYFFPGPQTQQEFLKNPVKYIPALGGDCTVCLANAGKRVPGNIRFASLHNNRLYLFPSADQKQIFDQSPRTFENTDLGFDGNCIVCKVNANKTIPGSAQFTAIHDGLRYQFPSDRERQAFSQTPRQYLAAATKPMRKDSMHANHDQMMRHDKKMDSMHGASMMKPKMKGEMRDTSMMHDSMHGKATTTEIQFRGITACAACEFGVKPIGSPEELGLAVKTSDGKIFVIEDGHSLWPEVYKMRFDGQQVTVSGRILKTKDNIAWVKPNRLTTL